VHHPCAVSHFSCRSTSFTAMDKLR
jgi:hypothetical protein